MPRCPEDHVLLAVAFTVVAGFGLAAIGWSAVQSRRRRRQLIQRLRLEWGRPRTEHYPTDQTGFYHAAHGGVLRGSLDPTTWADLILDAAFGFLDRTESVLGREVLYSRLRETRGSQEELLDFDRLVERFERDEGVRLAVQTSLAGITERSATTAWQLALEASQPPPRWMSWVLPGVALIAAVIPVALNRLEFDYRLRPGVAPSRNAIALLQLLGAPNAVVEDAQARADRIAAAANSGQGG
jgi:hypothetical protein